MLGEILAAFLSIKNFIRVRLVRFIRPYVNMIGIGKTTPEVINLNINEK